MLCFLRLLQSVVKSHVLIVIETSLACVLYPSFFSVVDHFDGQRSIKVWKPDNFCGEKKRRFMPAELFSLESRLRLAQK